MTYTPAIRKLEDEALACHADLRAILNEHVPKELRERCHELVDDLRGNAYSQAFEQDRGLYGALIALLPDNISQVRAAFSATIFDKCEDDWEGFERYLPITIMPPSKMERLLRGDMEAGG